MNHFSSAFYYLKGELILNGQIEKYWTSLSRSSHKISPLSFPERSTNDSKNCLCRAYGLIYLLHRITFPLSKLPRLHHRLRKESLEKNVKRTRLIAYKINVRTYPTKNISMKCHLDFFKACFRLLLVRWSGGKSVACRCSSCLQHSCG